MWFDVKLEKRQNENNFFVVAKKSSKKCRTYRKFIFVYRKDKDLQKKNYLGVKDSTGL